MTSPNMPSLSPPPAYPMDPMDPVNSVNSAAQAPRERRHRIAGWSIWLLILGAFGLAFLQASRRPPPAPFATSVEDTKAATTPATATEEPRFDSGFLPNPKLSQSHAASLVALPNGRMRAFWMDGEEGNRDAVISSSLFDPQRAAWGEPTFVTDAGKTEPDVRRHVRKIGNMVAHRAADGKLWLFYVTVSVGGWGGSSISFRTSSDGGASWSGARRMITSPFLNFSTLVRNAPIEYADGTIGLPVYHEFLNKFSELIRIDASGAILDRQRLNDRFVAIQPQVLVHSPTKALVLMRNAGGVLPRKVIQSSTEDAGGEWIEASESPLANPGAPVSGVVLNDSRLLIAFNSGESRRRVMAMALSDDQGGRWRTIQVFDNQLEHGLARVEHKVFVASLRASAIAAGADADTAQKMSQFAATVRCNDSCDFEFSYPFVRRASSGEFHLVYTWNRAFIRWARFNQAWVDQQAAGAVNVPAN